MKSRSRIFDRLRKNGVRRVLDFGSGAGFLLEAARRLGFEIAGVEISDHLTRMSKKYFDIVPAKNLGELSGNFDAIFMDNVIEHLPPDNIRDLMEQIRGKITHGGRLVGWTPNFASFNIHLLKDRDPVIYPPSHLCYFDTATIHRFLSDLGFERKHLDTQGLASHAFFRPSKQVHAFYEGPNVKPVAKAAGLAIRIAAKLASMPLSMVGMGYMVYFEYEMK